MSPRLSFGRVRVWSCWHRGSALVWYWLGLISGASHQWHCVSLFAIAALHPLLFGFHSQHANATLTAMPALRQCSNLNVFCFASNSPAFFPPPLLQCTYCLFQECGCRLFVHLRNVEMWAHSVKTTVNSGANHQTSGKTPTLQNRLKELTRIWFNNYNKPSYYNIRFFPLKNEFTWSWCTFEFPGC